MARSRSRSAGRVDRSLRARQLRRFHAHHESHNPRPDDLLKPFTTDCLAQLDILIGNVDWKTPGDNEVQWESNWDNPRSLTTQLQYIRKWCAEKAGEVVEDLGEEAPDETGDGVAAVNDAPKVAASPKVAAPPKDAASTDSTASLANAHNPGFTVTPEPPVQASRSTTPMLARTPRAYPAEPAPVDVSYPSLNRQQTQPDAIFSSIRHGTPPAPAPAPKPTTTITSIKPAIDFSSTKPTNSPIFSQPVVPGAFWSDEDEPGPSRTEELAVAAEPTPQPATQPSSRQHSADIADVNQVLEEMRRLAPEYRRMAPEFLVSLDAYKVTSLATRSLSESRERHKAAREETEKKKTEVERHKDYAKLSKRVAVETAAGSQAMKEVLAQRRQRTRKAWQDSREEYLVALEKEQEAYREVVSAIEKLRIAEAAEEKALEDWNRVKGQG